MNQDSKNISLANNSNELTSLLKKEIDKQDLVLVDFNILAKNIKKTNIEVQNELVQQNKLLKTFDNNVILFIF